MSCADWRERVGLVLVEGFAMHRHLAGAQQEAKHAVSDGLVEARAVLAPNTFSTNCWAHGVSQTL